MCAVASLYSTVTAGVTSPARALPNRAAEAYQVATISSLVDGGYHGDTIPVPHPSGSSESELRRLDVALRTVVPEMNPTASGLGGGLGESDRLGKSTGGGEGGQPARILLIEDDFTTQRMIASYLEERSSRARRRCSTACGRDGADRRRTLRDGRASRRRRGRPQFRRAWGLAWARPLAALRAAPPRREYRSRTLQ